MAGLKPVQVSFVKVKEDLIETLMKLSREEDMVVVELAVQLLSSLSSGIDYRLYLMIRKIRKKGVVNWGKSYKIRNYGSSCSNTRRFHYGRSHFGTTQFK